MVSTGWKLLDAIKKQYAFSKIIQVAYVSYYASYVKTVWKTPKIILFSELSSAKTCDGLFSRWVTFLALSVSVLLFIFFFFKMVI